MEKLYSSKTCLKMAGGGDASPTSSLDPFLNVDWRRNNSQIRFTSRREYNSSLLTNNVFRDWGMQIVVTKEEHYEMLV